MIQNLEQNKNKGSSLLNKGASFICCGTAEYTLKEVQKIFVDRKRIFIMLI